MNPTNIKYTEMVKNKTLTEYGFSGWNQRGIRKMTTIKESAENYKGMETKNIAELATVPVDIDITEETYTDKNGEEFTVNEIEVEGEKYRVPNSVLISLKAILEKRPDLKEFSVSKQGEGLNTKYTVVPM